MQAAEVNIQINLETGQSLVGTTKIEYIVEGPGDLTPRTLAFAIGTPNTVATRLTLATDFPCGGNYITQLEATFADGRFLRSPRKLLQVGAAFND